VNLLFAELHENECHAHHSHVGERAADVKFGPVPAKVQVLGDQRFQQPDVEPAQVGTGGGGRVAQQVDRRQVGVRLREGVDLAPEEGRVFVLVAVNERDPAAGLVVQEGLEQGKQRGNAAAGPDQEHVAGHFRATGRG
jgi:hypothetical protein